MTSAKNNKYKLSEQVTDEHLHHFSKDSDGKENIWQILDFRCHLTPTYYSHAKTQCHDSNKLVENRNSNIDTSEKQVRRKEIRSKKAIEHGI